MSAVLVVPTMKRCPWCEQDLPLDAFHRASGLYYPDGRFYICKECKKTRSGQSGRKPAWQKKKLVGPSLPRRARGSVPALETEIARLTDYLALVRAAYADGAGMSYEVRTWIAEQEQRLAELWERKRRLIAQRGRA